jgi:hypothetical protein
MIALGFSGYYLNRGKPTRKTCLISTAPFKSPNNIVGSRESGTHIISVEEMMNDLI